MQHVRADIAELQVSQRTVNGFLKAPCYATRAGVFLYLNPDGTTRRELRPPEEVFHEDSLATLASLPVTDEHPQELITPANAQKFARGVTGEKIERDRDLVKTTVTIFDNALISTLENRKKSEVSMGYLCDIDPTPGEYNGERYDAVQRKIRYNHLAVVTKGRAGPSVRVRIDGADCAEQIPVPQGKEDTVMGKIRIDEAEFEVSEPVALAMSQKMKRDSDEMTGLRAEIDKLKGQNTAQLLENETLKRQVAEVQSQPKMDSAQIHDMVMARINLVKKAEPFLKEIKTDSLTDRDIKIEVIKTRVPEFKADTASDAFIDGLFEGLTASAPRVDSLARTVTDAKQTNAQVINAAEARKRAMEADKNAWKRA